jgi:hypothetical protein
MLTTMPSTIPTTKPIKADHEITITLEGGEVRPPNPIPTMAVGETVLYRSNVPVEVRIEFPGQSPFRADGALLTSVPGGVILTLQTSSGSGTLGCHCFITPAGGQEAGWGVNNPLAGGQHKVTPPK